MYYQKVLKTLLAAAVLLVCSARIYAQDDAAALAQKLANPVSSLISVPFQINTDYGIGPLDGSRNIVNFQPVVPISINKNLNLITRMVLPIISQYNITGVGQQQSGLGDALVSAFFSPTKGGLTWGVGPALSIPTATSDAFASKKLGIGPTAVALKQSHGWTYGALVNQIWSIVGSGSTPSVSQAFIQPFLTYNWKTGAGLGGTLEWTQNWKASTTTMYLVPTVSGITSLGGQKVQLAVGPRFNIAAIDGGKADLGWRAVVAFIFPKK
jgi:hypothetical protein